VFARDFATADGHRVLVAALTPRQFADLATMARLARTFAFLERLLPADFSTRGDLYTHRATLAALLAPWFARRTVAGLAAAFAVTSVPWTHADQAGTSLARRQPRMGSGAPSSTQPLRPGATCLANRTLVTPIASASRPGQGGHPFQQARGRRTGSGRIAGADRRPHRRRGSSGPGRSSLATRT
jgi:crotonobetainyl-CoA:carnitine CoA-transferase CaiB-like acyl-CoA transferase